MIFQCRNCGKTSGDVDMVLDGACSCGCSHFKLATKKPLDLDLPPELAAKEAIRRDLHYWLDLNLDSMDPESVGNIRVRFEIDKPKE